MFSLLLIASTSAAATIIHSENSIFVPCPPRNIGDDGNGTAFILLDVLSTQMPKCLHARASIPFNVVSQKR